MKRRSALSNATSTFSNTIVVLSILIIDLLLGNVHTFMADAETMDEYYVNVMVFNVSKSFFDWMPYIMLILYGRMNRRIYFTIPDKLMAFVGLFFAMINTSDWFTNGNWRPVWADWTAFLIIMSILLYFRMVIWKVSRT